MYAYREAYDILRSTEPISSNDNPAPLYWSVDDVRKTEYNPNTDYNNWAKQLSHEVEEMGNGNFSLSEIAAFHLCRLTYYGFSPKDIVVYFKDINMGLASKYKADSKMERTIASFWEHQNQSKNIYEVTDTSNYSKRDLVRYDYRAASDRNPLAYIFESLTKYQSHNPQDFRDATIILKSPDRSPLNEQEIAEFQNGIRHTLGYKFITFGHIKDNFDEVSAILLLTK